MRNLLGQTSAPREGSLVYVAYRLIENDHPDFAGLEIEIAGTIGSVKALETQPHPS